MLPPLADIEQFSARLPGGLDPADETRAEALLEDASALVRSEAGVDWVDAGGELTDVPDIIRVTVLAAAKRAFINPDGVTAEAIQDYQASFSSASPDIYLTKQERAAVRRAVGRRGVFTISTTRTDLDTDTPAVHRRYWAAAPSEEIDPYRESWP